MFQLLISQVSRAFGDIQAKLPEFGGNPKVLISKPEITKMKINKEHDFIILGCKLILYKFLKIIRRWAF